MITKTICLFLTILQPTILLNSVFALNSDEVFKLKLKSYEKLQPTDFEFNAVNELKNNYKRDTTVNKVKDIFLNTNELRFSAYNREFHIYLKRHTNLLTNSITIELKYANKTAKYLNDFITSNYYVGYVDHEPDSFVLFYYEHDDQNDQSNQTTIIFGKIQLQNDTFYIEPSNDGDFVIYRSEDVKSELFTDDGRFKHEFCKAKHIDETAPASSLYEESVTNHSRSKRADANKNRCRLALVADWRFFRNIGNNNEKLTTLNMINTIGSINNIYTKTKFGYEIKDFGFDIEKIIVHVEPNDEANHYNTKNDITVADNLLELFGTQDWSQYCLAHLFTFQNFDGQVLGLAYVSSPRISSYGGICSSLMPRKGIKFSSNTGLSSYKSVSNSQTRLLQREAELVTSHEFGHNWGSEHDPNTDRCTPSVSNGGNYIMYAFANQGYDRNNYEFSPCSIVSMSEVLKAKSDICFKEKSKSFCGNFRIEEGEECDAGIGTRKGEDKCCDPTCRLRSRAVCSDTNHECCTDCRLAPTGKVCFTSQTYAECYNQKSYCNGISKECPPQEPKPKNTQCSSYDSGLCDENGHCLSLCQQIHPLSLPCLCTKEEEKCMQCCQRFNNSECIPIHLYNGATKPVFLTDGRPCTRGICKENVCKIKVKDYVGRFWTIIEKITVNAAVEFMKRNIVGTVIILSLIIWVPISCCIHFCIDKKMRAEQKMLYAHIRQVKAEKRKSFADVVLDQQDMQLYKFSDVVG